MKHLNSLFTVTALVIALGVFAQQGKGGTATIEPRPGKITNKTVTPPDGKTDVNHPKASGSTATGNSSSKQHPKPKTIIYPGTNTTGNAPRRTNQ